MSTIPRARHRSSAITLIQQALLASGEVGWLAAWSLSLGLWLGGSRRPVVELPLMLAVMSVAAVVARLALAASLPPRSVRALLAAVAIVGIGAAGLAAIPDQSRIWPVDWHQALEIAADQRVVTAGLLAAAAWWRGLTLGAHRPNTETAGSTLRTGTVALTLLLTAVMLVGKGAAPQTTPLVVAVAVVLFAGLVGLPLARIAEVGQPSPDGEAARSAPSGPWLTMLVGVAAAALLATLLVAEALTVERIGVLLEMLSRPLDAIIWFLLWVVAVPLGLLAEILIEFVRSLLRPQSSSPPPPAAAGDLLQTLRAMQNDQMPVLSPEATLVLRALLIIGLAALGIWLASRAISRLQRWQSEDDVEELRDIVWRWPGLRAIWAWALGRLRRGGGAAQDGTASSEGPVLGGSVRDLYRQFLSLATAVGWPRRGAETPLEYAGRLRSQASLPGADEVRSLTDDYNVARYAPAGAGVTDPSKVANVLARLRGLWLTIDGELQLEPRRARDSTRDGQGHDH